MQTPTLEQYLQTVRRHFLLLLISCLAGLLLGGYVLRQEEPLFTATTTILLTEIPSYAALDPEDPDARKVTIDTDAALVRSQDVVSRVAERTQRDETDVRAALSVSAVALTDVLRVSFSDVDASRAARGAQVAAAALLDARAETLPGSQDEQVKRLRDRIARLITTLGDERVANHEELLVSRLTSLRRFLNEVLRASPDSGTILRQAQVPAASERVNPEVKLASGAMLGLLGGLLFGVARDTTRRQRSSDPMPFPRRDKTAAHTTESRGSDEPFDERPKVKGSLLRS